MGETIAARKCVLVGGVEVDPEGDITVNGKDVGSFRDLYNKLIKSKQAVETLQGLLERSEKAYDKSAKELDAALKKNWDLEQKNKDVSAGMKSAMEKQAKAEFAATDSKQAHDLLLIENNQLRAEVNSSAIEVTAMKGAALYAEKRAAQFEAECDEWKEAYETLEAAHKELADRTEYAQEERVAIEAASRNSSSPAVDPRVDSLQSTVDSLKYQLASVVKLIDPLGVLGLVTIHGAKT